MARRTKEEMQAEFERLYDITLLWYGFSWPSGHTAPSPEYFAAWRDEMLALVKARDATWSEVLIGIRQDVNECAADIEGMLVDAPELARDFLAYYRDRTGRDYFQDVGSPRKAARRILKRGTIRNETEFYLITEILSDTEQTVFSAEEAERMGEMLSAFEDSAAR